MVDRKTRIVLHVIIIIIIELVSHKHPSVFRKFTFSLCECVCVHMHIANVQSLAIVARISMNTKYVEEHTVVDVENVHVNVCVIAFMYFFVHFRIGHIDTILYHNFVEYKIKMTEKRSTSEPYLATAHRLCSNI